MHTDDEQRRAAWTATTLTEDPSWQFTLDEAARDALAASIRAAFDPDRPLLDYEPAALDLEPAWPTIALAFEEAKRGRGIALLRGLPRDALSEAEFTLLNWAIGLRAGVPRPQGRATQYLSAVRDAGTDYRAATGRGYSSNAALDFHVDGADLATLGCYNTARSGGQSLVTSAIAAYEVLHTERPDLAEVARDPFCFSRQGEQAADEAPFYAQPLFDFEDGRLFAKWNRNRVQSAQRLDGVPTLSVEQRETIDVLDAILRRPNLLYTMYLAPGDLQIMNNHVILHSRTGYVDHDDPARRRLLCRLWLAPPDSVALPESWRAFYRCVAPGTVRGGIRGHRHDAACQAFERRQAAALGMRLSGDAASVDRAT